MSLLQSLPLARRLFALVPLCALATVASAQDAAPFRVLAVGADRDGTGGAQRAERAGIATFVARVPDYVTRADWDLDLARLVAGHAPDLVVSAGFMKVLGPAVLGDNPEENMPYRHSRRLPDALPTASASDPDDDDDGELT